MLDHIDIVVSDRICDRTWLSTWSHPGWRVSEPARLPILPVNGSTFKVKDRPANVVRAPSRHVILRNQCVLHRCRPVPCS